MVIWCLVTRCLRRRVEPEVLGGAQLSGGLGRVLRSRLRSDRRLRVLVGVVKEGGRRSEEQTSRQRRGEIEDAVVVALGLPQEHTPEHELGDAWVRGVAHEERALLPGGLTEGQIVTHDLELVAVGVLNGVHGDVAVGGLLIIGELGVIELGAPDDAFLFLDAQ